jgi:hypothetical protein
MPGDGPSPGHIPDFKHQARTVSEQANKDHGHASLSVEGIAVIVGGGSNGVGR